MRIGIVGYGIVGKHLERIFLRAGFLVSVYDKYIEQLNTGSAKETIQSSDLVFVAVSTPQSKSGAADISSVEDAVSWITRPVCIKSTIPPGTTDRLISTYKKPIIFSPEYVGETPYHRCNKDVSVDLVVFGGLKADSIPFADIYKEALGPDPSYFFTDAITAELAKYMENCFFATKVAFVAQFYELSRSLEADFDQLREIWIADSRVGRSHSHVIGRPGFSGKCLPKDLAAIIAVAKDHGGAPLLEAVQSYNRAIRGEHTWDIFLDSAPCMNYEL